MHPAYLSAVRTSRAVSPRPKIIKGCNQECIIFEGGILPFLDGVSPITPMLITALFLSILHSGSDIRV